MQSPSCARFFVTPRTVARGFPVLHHLPELVHTKSLQSCQILCDPMGHSLLSSSVHGILQARTGAGCRVPLQEIFSTQGSNPSLLCLLHWQAGSLPLVPPGKPVKDTSLQAMAGHRKRIQKRADLGEPNFQRSILI